MAGLLLRTALTAVMYAAVPGGALRKGDVPIQPGDGGHVEVGGGGRVGAQRFTNYSVSGFSSGGSMAIAHLVAYSETVTGAGVIGGSPYGCNILPDSGNTCSGWSSNAHTENRSIPWHRFVDQCNAYMRARAAAGKVDPLSALVGRPVYLLSGFGDETVYQSVMRAVALQFRGLDAAVETEFTLNVNHAWVVDNQTCTNIEHQGAPNGCCGVKGRVSCPLPPHAAPVPTGGCCGGCGNLGGWRPPINNCNYDMSGAMFRWLSKPGNIPIQPRGAEAPSHLFQLNQSDFMPPGWTVGKAQLDATGWVYAPPQCRGRRPTTAGCSLHIHYHPCGGDWRVLSTNYMLETGIAAYAETNNIVVLHPQTVMNGCWDWYGATGANFDTKTGVQMNVAINMAAAMPAWLAAN